MIWNWRLCWSMSSVNLCQSAHSSCVSGGKGKDLINDLAPTALVIPQFKLDAFTVSHPPPSPSPTLSLPFHSQRPEGQFQILPLFSSVPSYMPQNCQSPEARILTPSSTGRSPEGFAASLGGHIQDALLEADDQATTAFLHGAESGTVDVTHEKIPYNPNMSPKPKAQQFKRKSKDKGKEMEKMKPPPKLKKATFRRYTPDDLVRLKWSYPILFGTPESKQNMSLIHRFLEHENIRINKSKVSGDDEDNDDSSKDKDDGDQNKDEGHNEDEDGNLNEVTQDSDLDEYSTESSGNEYAPSSDSDSDFGLTKVAGPSP
ncbi:hypothetical protein BDZ97DRAFT_1765263 [Flammula alnicola]|nr:hypothetical protein BDZ97DRAFT_1765263 [Flammula alnicola]